MAACTGILYSNGQPDFGERANKSANQGEQVMHHYVKKLAPVLSLAVLGGAPLAYAGSTTESAYCYKNTDGSGSCYGTFLGFRNHAGSGTYAYFYKHSSGSKSFSGAYTDTSTNTTSYFSCTPDAATGALWTKAVAAQGYFSISWNTSGTCTYLSLYNGSLYSNF
jgi:hypothetical protein